MTTTPPPLAIAKPRMDLDNLLRRELKVGDPNDPQQIAKALAERYQGDLRAQAIDGEARGLPFLRTPSLRTSSPPPPTATNVDLEQAKSDVQIDIEQLVSHNLTKDIRLELEGWQQAIHRGIDDGVANARYGLDPIARDRAFGARRQLGDYARLARLIGVLTPALNRQFRNLAQSIDESSAVMLVMLGESMANLGFAGGRFLLTAPYSELQARRDAAINALRQVDNLSATGSNGNGSYWPRGLRAYRTLATALEAQGHGDLRSLLEEGELTRTLDELIHIASGGASGGLRALGATAWAPLNRLSRFVDTTLAQVAPASSELATLHEALQLFIEAFVPAGGFRLLRVARPAVLNYGLYGSSAISKAESRLIDLVTRRGSLVRELDCFTDCNCDDDHVHAQIVLDKMVFDLDRAIDYYSVGDADLGLPEARASAFAHSLDFLTTPALWPALLLPRYLGGGGAPNLIVGPLRTQLEELRALVRPTGAALDWDPGALAFYDASLASNAAFPGGVTARFAQVIHDELFQQRSSDQQWIPVVSQMTAGCLPSADIFGAAGSLRRIVEQPLLRIETDTAAAPGGPVVALPAPVPTHLPPHFEDSLEVIALKP